MFLFFSILGLIFPFFANAQPGSLVVINEIAWMGTPVVGIDSKQHWRYEWLELRGTTKNPVAMDAWSIELYRGEELYFAIPLTGTIPGAGYFVIGAAEKIPHVDVNYANLGGKLVNSGMRVVLKNKEGNTADEVDARNGWQGGEKTPAKRDNALRFELEVAV